MRSAVVFATGVAAVAAAAALQFDVVPGAQHCFTEDIAPGTAVAVSYIVVDGAGDLPVTLLVRHVPSDAVVYAHDAIESGKFSFFSPVSSRDYSANSHQALPPASGTMGSEPSVALESERGANSRGNLEVAAQGQALLGVDRDAVEITSDRTSSTGASAYHPHGAGNGSIASYSFCFGETHGSGLLHLFPRRPFGGGMRATRRVIFELVTGAAAARVPPGALSLAKELHLTESDQLLSQVHAHVANVVGQVDRMQTSARELDEMNAATGLRVALYSMMTCVSIVVAGLLSAEGTRITLRAQKEH